MKTILHSFNFVLYMKPQSNQYTSGNKPRWNFALTIKINDPRKIVPVGFIRVYEFHSFSQGTPQLGFFVEEIIIENWSKQTLNATQMPLTTEGVRLDFAALKVVWCAPLLIIMRLKKTVTTLASRKRQFCTRLQNRTSYNWRNGYPTLQRYLSYSLLWIFFHDFSLLDLLKNLQRDP